MPNSPSNDVDAPPVTEQPCRFPDDSVGLVTPQIHHFTNPLLLTCGQTLSEFTLIYETYGRLNADASNAILICHALSGHHHAAGFHDQNDKKPGWWDQYIGPGKPIDTNRFFVVSLNNLGGCHGSTGPTSINPDTGEPWGSGFPLLRVRDWVNSQARLADTLGIQCWAAVIGGSLGGMQAMRWSLEYPDRVRHCIVIASSMKLTAQNIAFNEAARSAITSDPEFFGGDYLKHHTYPKGGLSVARMIGHITYLSGDGMGNKFGRELKSGSFKQGDNEPVEFQIESYLRYQGANFSKSFDANTYILMTKALDYFDLSREYNDNPVTAFEQSTCNFLVISFSSDWRFSPERSREIVNALIAAKRPVSYAEIDSQYGHDAFLLPNERYQTVFSQYLNNIDIGTASKPKTGG
ncbi:homoserine O-succinyltransferase MetX [Marinibactrum halimedae]|uniref:Homoserine O-succinyltransferase n=1 Tax=Marinibactrum halimedae TaxID=1444977 RepID=A0AA37T579_9GAMM|nr:homoserine O-acetyltransferase [Marinibactrum halimedae]MCD9458314.1 homoserine O-acetyltransferase [Marinibactrum halimedae]GLS27059.1 homoserine O-acetyltransferase [Marinibactrum halimedae]